MWLGKSLHAKYDKLSKTRHRPSNPPAPPHPVKGKLNNTVPGSSDGGAPLICPVNLSNMHESRIWIASMPKAADQEITGRKRPRPPVPETRWRAGVGLTRNNSIV